MAKTESTAVNELIELVQSKQAAPAEPAADLFAASEPIARPARVTPPRMVAPVPPLPRAAEVAPLPPRRAPHATSRQRVVPAAPPVRISTADPELARTIPPLSQPSTSPPPRAHATGRNPTPRSMRAQRPASPAPAAHVAMGSSPSSVAPVPPPPPHLRASQPAPAVTHAHEGSDVTPLPLPRADDSPLPIAWNGPLSTEPSPLAITQRPTVPSAPSLPPPTAPVAAPFEASPRRSRNTTGNPLVARPVPQQYPVVRPEWFDSGRLKKVDRTEGTAIVSRQYGDGLLKKLIVPMLLAIFIGVAIGGYLAMNARDGKKASQATAAIAPSGDTRVAMPVSPAEGAEVDAPAQVANAGGAQADSESIVPAATAAALAGAEAAPAPAAPAPAAEPPAAEAPAAVASADSGAAAAPAVREVQTTRGVIKLVDVRIDSTPAGATVMLVDGGKTSFLGSTPLATSLDPSRTYDVIFTLPGRPTQMAALDPAKTSRLDVTLGRAKSERAAKKKSRATAESSFDDALEAQPAKAEKPEKADKTDKADKADKAVAETKAAPTGEGTLMVNSKPPCEILIDGKPTGLTTPQRSISLPAGTHKVTFVNASAGIHKTVSVTITAGQATKLIQDLMTK